MRTRTVERLALIFAMMPILSCLMGGGQKDEGKKEGWIAFVSDREGDNEIYRMRPNGTKVKNLTNCKANDREPAWSPDAQKIAFSSDRGGNLDVYVMSADGSDVKRLTYDDAHDYSPAWSPDGKEIVFISDREESHQIYTMDSDGKNVKRVQRKIEEVEVGGDLSYSPDGKKFLFVSQNGKICVINKDGTNLVIMTKRRRFEVAPQWSSDGERIAFHSACRDEQEEGHGGHIVIYIMQNDGSDVKALIHRPFNVDGHSRPGQGLDECPSWSPDGKKIVFSSTWEDPCPGNLNGNFEIYIMDIESKDILRLTNSKAKDTMPRWSPIPK